MTDEQVKTAPGSPAVDEGATKSARGVRSRSSKGPAAVVTAASP